MKLKALAVTIALMMICSCGCCGTEEDNLLPSKELQQVVDHGSFAWLNSRMWEEPWNIFHSRTAAWRTAASIEDIVSFFVILSAEVEDESSLWDYQVLVNDIQADSIYLAENPPVQVFTAQLIKGLEYAERQITQDFGE